MNKIGHYTSLTEANGFVFCSGQVGLNEATGLIVSGIEAQTRLTIQSIEKLLQLRDLDLTSIVKANVYITRDEDFEVMNQVYKEMLGDNLPARTTVVVNSLPKAASEGPQPILVEIDVVAASN